MDNQGFSKISLLIILVVLVTIGGMLIWQFQQPASKKSKEDESSKDLEGKMLKIEIKEDKVDEALSYCDKIVDPKTKDACIGLAKGEMGACENLESIKKASCYISLARRKGDKTICEKIDNKLKYHCLALLTGDDRYCNQAWSSTRSDCYEYAALVTKDASKCRKIADKQYSDSCLALIKEDAQLCSSRYCYLRLALLTGDASICEEMEKLKNTCEAWAARSTANLDCAGEDGGVCETIAAFTKDGSICSELEHPRFETIGDPCYFDIAMNLLGVYLSKLPQGW